MSKYMKHKKVAKKKGEHMPKTKAKRSKRVRREYMQDTLKEGFLGIAFKINGVVYAQQVPITSFLAPVERETLIECCIASIEIISTPNNPIQEIK